MKCEHCGKNEVAFMYRSNINGHVEEIRLCAACARKFGYGSEPAPHSQRMVRDFWGGSLFSDRMLDAFFAPANGADGLRRWLLEDPFEELFREMPALGIREEAKEQPAPQEELLEQEERSRFSRMRELNALRLEKKRAVREENFERAAQLRDRIKELESENRGEKESA